jgi:glutamate/tyrosine decarboxylase-like PLP-dependent enzyme
VHGYTDQQLEVLGDAILAYSHDRLKLDPVPLDGPRTRAELDAKAGQTITEDGIGGLRALKLFEEELAPACISTDHPRYLSFIPCAPTEAAAMFDLVVGASSIYGGSWLEGAGAVYAENQALRWIADLVGLPPEAGGVFVPGGTIGNLSALVAARHSARARAQLAGRTGAAARPWRIAATHGAHSSIESASQVMDAELVGVEVDEEGRLTGAALREVLEANGPETFFAVVATAGTTNLGIVDDLASVAQVCREFGVWFHVDGAYGGAGLAAPSVRHLYAGVEHCDSFIVDPHKWLFSPFDCCALLYREPALARAAHTQHAAYLDVLTEAPDWNPTDYSIGLTRRARGLPFWFSLATHGTRAYAAAIEQTLATARFAAEEVRRRDHLELLRDPELSVVVFRRLGWSPQDYQEWSDRLLAEEFAFVVPTSHAGETLCRFAIVNPRTSEDDIRAILDTMG